MTAEQIRRAESNIPCTNVDIWNMLREIAAQMAEQNVQLKKISERV